MEAHLEELAVAESWENGKPVRETLAADIPLAIDHFRYFAGVLRAQEGSLSELDEDTVAYHFHEPLGVVGQIIPWNFPDPDGHLEARPGAGRGQRGGPQAGRADSGLHPLLDEPGGRSAAARDRQHRQRLRRGGRQAAGLQPARREDRVHRGDHDGAADHAVRLREPQAGDTGAGRQVAEHLLRRRLPQRRRLPRQGPRRLHHVRPQPGRGVHVSLARPDPARALRRLPGGRDRPHGEDPAGQPTSTPTR
ncbi:NAD/NADP-dependent betaine aldehyde dehydrogenase [Streptomyces cyaneofuscatus]